MELDKCMTMSIHQYNMQYLLHVQFLHKIQNNTKTSKNKTKPLLQAMHLYFQSNLTGTDSLFMALFLLVQSWLICIT